MATFETSGDTTTSPVFTKPGRVIYPFAEQGDTTTCIVEQEFYVRAASYAPPTLDSAYSSSANLPSHPSGSLYCVGDSEVTPDEAGGVTFLRRWSKIPSPRTVAGGSYAYTFPGIAGTAGGTAQTITAASFSAPATWTFTKSGHGLNVGDTLQFSFKSGNFVLFFLRNVLSTPTANTFTVYFGYSGVFTSGSYTKYTPIRNPKTLKASAVILYEYALPGISSGVTSIADYPATPVFQVVGTSGIEEVDNVVDAATVPNASEYLAYISGQTQIVAESSVSRWAGNILQRETILIVAQ